MNISNELKEKIENLLKNNPKLRDQVLSGDVKGIQEIAIIGQKNIPPEDIIEAYENHCIEYLVEQARKKIELKKLYVELREAYWEDKNQGENER